MGTIETSDTPWWGEFLPRSRSYLRTKTGRRQLQHRQGITTITPYNIDLTI